MDDLGNGLPGDDIDEPVRRIREPEIMGRASAAPPGAVDEPDLSGAYDEDAAGFTQPSPEAEEVERQLAHYAFVREEREREVRLLFRDVPADEVAAAFRAAGASLITLAGEREVPPIATEVSGNEQVEHPPKRRRKRAGPKTLGPLSMRYFYALGETVYTITITAPSEVVASVAPIFPVAALFERELHERMAIVFRGLETDSETQSEIRNP